MPAPVSTTSFFFMQAYDEAKRYPDFFFFAAVFLAGDFFAAAFLAGAFLAAIFLAGVLVSASAAGAVAFFAPNRPKRPFRSGALAASSTHSSRVRSCGSLSFGILTFLVPAFMYGPN